MDNAMPYMYNPNISNVNPNFINRDLREINKRIDGLERRINRLEKRISNMSYKDTTEMNNEYYPPANDNYML